jgi:hypothetical protein
MGETEMLQRIINGVEGVRTPGKFEQALRKANPNLSRHTLRRLKNYKRKYEIAKNNVDAQVQNYMQMAAAAKALSGARSIKGWWGTGKVTKGYRSWEDENNLFKYHVYM